MAHLWVQMPDAEAGWGIAQVRNSVSVITPDPQEPVCEPRTREGTPGPLLMRRSVVQDEDLWVLLAAPRHNIRVNGMRQSTGAQVLADRDEIAFAGGPRFFFSTERLTEVVEFPGSDMDVRCARCRTAISKGDLAAECPNCGVWHHQTEEFPCWTYDTVCAGCRKQPTALDGGYRFTPEGL